MTVEMRTVSIIRAVTEKGIEDEACTKKRDGECTAMKIVSTIVTTGMSNMLVVKIVLKVAIIPLAREVEKLR